MSIHTDIVTALAGVAGGRIKPNIADPETDYPLVNYRILNKEHVTTIHGTVLATEYQVVFECWAKTYAAALGVADDVRAAIVASALDYSHVDEPGEEFDQAADSFMEPVYFSFLDQ